MSTQTSFGNILVTIDGSPHSFEAVEAAAVIASGFKANVTVLEVVSYGGLRSPLHREEFRARLEENAKKNLEKATSIVQSRGVTAATDVVHAKVSIVQSILDYASLKKSDLIVMGTRGLGGFEKMLVGSVSSGVATHSSVPVLIVRTGGLSERLQMKHILVAVDGSEHSQRATSAAVALTKALGSELTAFHVIHIPAFVYSNSSESAVNKIEKDEREEGQKVLADAVSVAKSQGVQAKQALIEEIASPAVRITRYAESRNEDLIVLGARGVGGFERLMLGSVAIGVLNYAHCSVLIVR